ncbi:MAG: 4'-phosphopantetheinyl transferase superfamily protein [Paludibacteraceae bacterium]|nr:4'-phosphopantetheinyl transferase superfamily protein [Paludibacteraceae bacterium]
MLVFREHINDAELIIWRMDETLEELLELSHHHYDHEIENISNDVRKKERIISRFLLETLVGKKVKVKYADSGKPFCDGVHFSISHTKNFVAVIVSNEPVGVDIEYKSDRIFRITEKFMHPDELKTLSECSEKQKFALICWCAKETVFKIIEENGVDFAKMNCKVNFDEIILTYKNRNFTLKFMDFSEFFIVFS